MRRRLHSGFTATLVYTFSKAIDDALPALGPGRLPPVSQHARPSLRSRRTGVILANRARAFDLRPASSFDMRMCSTRRAWGYGGGSLMSSWRGGSTQGVDIQRRRNFDRQVQIVYRHRYASSVVVAKGTPGVWCGQNVTGASLPESASGTDPESCGLSHVSRCRGSGAMRTQLIDHRAESVPRLNPLRDGAHIPPAIRSSISIYSFPRRMR